MLRGQVDKLTSELIAGWAADDEDKSRVVNIQIYLDGKLHSEVACDKIRNDLKLAGLGQGNHGFVFRWPEPLQSDRLPDVMVKFAGTDVSLRQPAKALYSNVVSVPERPTATPVRQDPGMRQLMKLPCPGTMRDLFLLFAAYDNTANIREFVRRITTPATSPSQPRPLVDALENELRIADGDFSNALYAYLHKWEFQENILSNLLKAFPGRRRLIFLHVPKCAGTDLGHKLARIYPTISANLARPQHTPPRQLFSQIADLSRHIPLSDAILVRDHMQLSYFIEQRLLRPTDEVFTVVRPPVELVVSQLNYVLSRFESDAHAGAFAADTSGWARTLGIDIPTLLAMDTVGMQALGRKMLSNSAIVPSNLICYWLGGGPAEAVQARLLANAVEVVHIKDYSSWLERRWGIRSSERLNVSKKFFTEDTFDETERAYIRDICAEDIRLIELLFPGDFKSSCR